MVKANDEMAERVTEILSGGVKVSSHDTYVDGFADYAKTMHRLGLPNALYPIPYENILVYIAIHADYRGQGLGRYLMENAIKTADGDIALHVEPDNPAKFLYEKLGFSNKYLEMRYKKQAQ